MKWMLVEMVPLIRRTINIMALELGLLGLEPVAAKRSGLQEFSLFYMSMERGILDEALHSFTEKTEGRMALCEASAKEVLPELPTPALPSKAKAWERKPA